MPSKKQNCWEFMKCGRGIGDPLTKGKELCQAAKEKRLHRFHGGNNSGRACWVVAGTHCGGTVQGSFAKKITACKRCDFYAKVHHEEGDKVVSTPSLLNCLKGPSTRLDITSKKLGLLLGGSGLIGGALMHHFKTKTSGEIEVLSPNSKKLSLREAKDIKQYVDKYQPDFIINSAIASLDCDAQMAYEVNFLGPLRLAKMAMSLKIPYIHFSSAAVLPQGTQITEENQVDLRSSMSNYAKSKLMAEQILQNMHDTQGLDYTIIRLAVVYGKHDHKIQGAHRMLFSIANEAMPFILSQRGILHSYSHTKKIPPFVSYVLENRNEFTGQTINFVDKEPVELVKLINTIKGHLKTKAPRDICIPYPMANMSQKTLKWVIKRFGKIGVEIRLPAELIFMRNFYKTQTLSTEKLEKSSYIDPYPDITIFSELPNMINYYITRWTHLNRLASFKQECSIDSGRHECEFIYSPETLLETMSDYSRLPVDQFEEKMK